MKSLISYQKSVVVACDVEWQQFGRLVQATHMVKGVGGYKIGLTLVLDLGLTEVVSAIRDHSDLPIIYDHQKGGTDIPEMGAKFAKTVKSAGVNAVILFPFGGAKTERDWIRACQDNDLVVLVGGHMTQPQFLESEEGFIADSAPVRIYSIAAEVGVTNFVVPGNKVDLVVRHRQLLENLLGKGNFTLFAAGFISQGGEISETGKAAGEKWHAIVGRAIYNLKTVEEMTAAAEKLVAQLI